MLEFALVPELPDDDQTLLHIVFSLSPRCASYNLKYLSWEMEHRPFGEICGYGTGMARCAMRLRGSDTSYGVRSDDLAYLALPTPTLTLPDTHTFRPYLMFCYYIASSYSF